MRDLIEQLNEMRDVMNRSVVTAHVNMNTVEGQIVGEFDGLIRHVQSIGQVVEARREVLFNEMTKVMAMFGAAPVHEPMPRFVEQSRQSLADATRYLPKGPGPEPMYQTAGNVQQRRVA